MGYHVEDRAWCNNCHFHWSPNEGLRACPRCGGPLEDAEFYACDACGELWEDSDDADNCCAERGCE